MREILTFNAEFATSDSALHGYAAVYEATIAPHDGRNFTFGSGAFDEILDANPDVVALFNHNPDLVLGRTAANTLRLSADSRGLEFEVYLPDTTVGRDVRTLVARGDIRGASLTVAFNREDLEDGPKGSKVITRVSGLFDVSPVTFPAFPDTEVGFSNSLNETSMSLEDEQDRARARLTVIRYKLRK